MYGNSNDPSPSIPPITDQGKLQSQLNHHQMPPQLPPRTYSQKKYAESQQDQNRMDIESEPNVFQTPESQINESKEQSMRKLVLLGQTGSGKSSIGNCLLNLTSSKKVFTESRGAESCTEDTMCKEGAWCTNGAPCTIIDTPGMDDSENRDTDHIENIIEYLKEGKYISSFVLVRNGQNKRMSNSFKSMLRIFEFMFGTEFWSHVIVDVSHVKYEDEEEMRREAKDWKKTLQKTFNKVKNAKLPTVFLNPKEKNNPRFSANAEKLWTYCQDMEDFECKDFETTKTEMDQLRSDKNQIKTDLQNYKTDTESKMRELEKEAEKDRFDFKEKLERLSLDAKNQKAKKKKIEQEMQRQQNDHHSELQKEKNKLVRAEEDFIAFEKQMTDKVNQQLLQAKENNEKSLKQAHEEKKELEIRLRNEKEQLETNHKEELKKVTDDTTEGLKKMTESMQFLNKQNEQNAQTQLKANKQVEEIIQKNTEKVQETVEKKIDLIDKQVKEVTKKIKKKEKNDKDLDKQVKEVNKKFKEQEKNIKKTKESYETKINDMVNEGKKSENDFEKRFPALKSRSDGVSAWTNLKSKNIKKERNKSLNMNIIRLEVNENEPLKAEDGRIAARILTVPGSKNEKPTKTALIVGMTGSGKSTLIDALTNYVYDVRYEDDARLKLISLTESESKKEVNQANSQTDYISVYKIQWMPGMNIDYNLVLIDTPGLGDTRGIEYDKKTIKNIEVLFNSSEVDSLDSIGFVAKAGDVRLTAEQKYIFESILQIFGKDVGKNLLSLLTFYDGNDLKVLDAFKEANIEFVKNFPFNSAGIFKAKSKGPVERSLLTTNPDVSFYQNFYNNSDNLFRALQSMQPRSLKLTQEVLKDREHIEATVEGLNIRVREQLLLKDRVDQEKRICEQHEADAKANEHTEYDVEESKVIKIDLETGVFVTNCLECNTSCHFPCGIKDDEKKYNCAAMGRGESQEATCCTVCPKKCHWQQHRNMSFRMDVESITVKKTYDDIKARHQDFLDLQKGQVTIVDALEIESVGLSDLIQSNVDFITKCLHRLSQNALRTSTTSSADYLEQMIHAEDHERKPGFQSRIAQLRKEKAKADALANICDGRNGKEIVSGGQSSEEKQTETSPGNAAKVKAKGGRLQKFTKIFNGKD